ncbi:NUDIX domain-containing protein [Serinibacter arcticus]|uniref:MutT-like protein n=1 Tax=Serinibacter arcticus TaxID=1655435 RepID=A0A4Z1E247_9MICO|nr:NUDIX domain-containing protein [Serinibacter arcticus]TGO05380.1 MutT-like protein [Serinibacter arcticus]
MPTARSAALLVARPDAVAGPLLLIGHMGGPFWARKDAGAWSIPKGEHASDEPAEAAARRELAEETGYVWPVAAPLVDLGEFRQSRKVVRVFLGVEPATPDGGTAAPWDLDAFTCNTFDVEWPPRSGVVRTFPELDRVGWVSTQIARTLLVAGQIPAVDAAVGRLGGESRDPEAARYRAL